MGEQKTRILRYPQKINKRFIGVTAVDRMFGFIDNILDSDCWEFNGSLDKNGYGQIRRTSGSMAYAHRLMYEELVGAIPEGLVLDHLCRVRNCINPDHLEPVTQIENVKRGLGITPALEAKRNKTTCKQGHSYTESNTYRHPDTGARNCKRCQYLRNIQSRARRLQNANHA